MFKVSKFSVHNAPFLLRRRRWSSQEYDAARDVAAVSLVHIIRYAAQNGQSSLVIPHLLLSARWKFQMRGLEKVTDCWAKENKYTINRLLRQFCRFLHRTKSNTWPISVHKIPTILAYANITFSLTLDNLGYHADGKLDLSSRLRRQLLYKYDLYFRQSGFKSQLVTTTLVFSWYF